MKRGPYRQNKGKPRTCYICGTTENLYATGAYCKTCLSARSKEKYKNQTQDYCSTCYESKSGSRTKQCKKCAAHYQSGYKYRDKSEDFKVDLYIFVEQIKRRGYNLYTLDIFKIIDLWCQITLQPHRYWHKPQHEQLKLMFDDLCDYLTSKEKIKKKNEIA
jgi:hypothetical protein